MRPDLEPSEVGGEACRHSRQDRRVSGHRLVDVRFAHGGSGGRVVHLGDCGNRTIHRKAPARGRLDCQDFRDWTSCPRLLRLLYAKHKKHPEAFKLEPYRGEDEDVSYCDEHAGFHKDDILRAVPLLKRGIRAGLFGEVENKGDPSRLWTVDDNGWIYEAQITNPGYAQYHAWPVQPTEAIARKVLARYEEYVIAQQDEVLTQSLAKARERYK